ncbi:potassium channel family protein [Pleurocapsa sp. PCC 7319]|uniref:potassium channel family protein n=1 Tax=Pleurocapsa sp. PCC 7319 TaxID=118161 RepID=UPI00034AE6D1|nr:potassium channel family protein [Pleurocapsa sp. PCC 7319]
MSAFLLTLGFILLTVVSSDVLTTTLTVKGGGFLTNRFSSWVWHNATKVHRHNNNHRLLAGMGLLLILGMAVLWYLLTWTAWSLIFCSYQDAILNASNEEPASTWGRIYFTAYTITTLGRGDYLPQSTIWHLLTGLAAANGFFLVTLSIAYLFPVVSAVTQKRILSVYLASLGGTADEIITRAWNNKNFGNLDQHLISLTPLISELGEKHLTYPILHYFHSRERTRSLPLSIAAFDEAMTILQYGVPENYQPDPAALNPARRACAAFLKTLKSAYLEPSDSEPPLTPLELLRNKSIPTVSDRQFQETTNHINKRRKLLLALVRNDGWSWDAIASSETTSRATSLDDETKIGRRVLY